MPLGAIMTGCGLTYVAEKQIVSGICSHSLQKVFMTTEDQKLRVFFKFTFQWVW